MKQLYRNKEAGKIAGVCAGIGDYFDVDPVLIRIILVVSVFFYGIGVLAYIVAWIVIPEQSVKNETLQGEKPMIDTNISVKSRLGALLFCFLLGWLGVHRFYAGKIGTGILMILTIGGLGIWWTIDCILILIGSFTDDKGQLITEWMPEPARSA